MLQKNARWYFHGFDVQGTVNNIGGALYHAGVTLAPSGPNRWEGIGPTKDWGMFPKIWITVMPDQGGFWLDVRLWAELDTTYQVLFVISWLLCWPFALFALLMGNSSWTGRSNELMYTMQQPVAHLLSTPNWGHPPS